MGQLLCCRAKKKNGVNVRKGSNGSVAWMSHNKKMVRL